MLEKKTPKGILTSTKDKGIKDPITLSLTPTTMMFLPEEGLVSSNNYGLRFVYSNDLFIKKEDVFFFHLLFFEVTCLLKQSLNSSIILNIISELLFGEII